MAVTVAEVLGESAVEQAARVRAGEVSARELVEASLARIAERDGEIGAFVALGAERALAEADAVRPGDPRSLCGVPIGVKDLLSATAGLPTTHGSSAFGDWIADHDSAHIRLLREAGAIVVGKTNSPELGLRPVTENARYGATRNPHDLSLSPGGSSGGSAAALAAGMVGLAEGSDLGGSLRIPAACCGLVGLKPSRGRVSIGPDFGDLALGVPVDGVLTRTVLDTAIALDAIAVAQPGDRDWAPPPAAGSFAAAVRQAPPRLSVRLALQAPLGVPIDDDPLTAARRTAERCSALGHDVDEGVPPWDDEGFPAAWSTFTTGTMQHVLRVLERLHGRALDPDRLEPASRGWLLGAPAVGLVDFLEAVERLAGFGRRLLAAWPPERVLVTPTLTRRPAPVGVQAAPGVTDDALRFSALVRIWNVTGQPAVSVPLHEAGDGIPVGVQLVGPPGRDDLVLALAAQLEAALA